MDKFFLLLYGKTWLNFAWHYRLSPCTFLPEIPAIIKFPKDGLLKRSVLVNKETILKLIKLWHIPDKATSTFRNKSPGGVVVFFLNSPELPRHQLNRYDSRNIYIPFLQVNQVEIGSHHQ